MKPSIEYFAGLFDGEGCICIARAKQGWKNSRSKSPAYELKVFIRMSDVRPIQIFKERFDGNISFQEYKPVNHRPTHCFYCSHTKAERVVKELLPYLIVKKEQAEVALEFQQYMRDSNCKKVGFARKPVPKYILEKRHQYYLTLKNLKRKVYPRLVIH
ncbi:hypothetical protein LCGC14_1692950 [marine sediment metagenome]|uniref:Homing endonuclease LAGLIDADG domain-containing protein n=1 Tax=marine sediment metagenome TaxID=412755 RepID=A0A0F9KKC6_9ZZZZ